MELRQLRAFVETAEAGSITAAARKLRVTQPALSRTIKSLEEELDVVLLERGAHSVSLTPAGEVLRTEALKVLKFCESMVQKVQAEAAGEPLRIAYSPSLAGEFLSIAIERFSQLHERVRITLFDWSSAEMRDGLLDGSLDLMVTVPDDNPAILWSTLRNCAWRVIVPANHPLAAQAAIAPADLHDQRMLMFERTQYPDYWHQVTAYFRTHAIQAKVSGEYDGIISLLAGVSAGLGIALVAETSRVEVCQGSRVAVKELTQQPGAIPIAAGIPRDRVSSACTVAFLEELRRAAAE